MTVQSFVDRLSTSENMEAVRVKYPDEVVIELSGEVGGRNWEGSFAVLAEAIESGEVDFDILRNRIEYEVGRAQKHKKNSKHKPRVVANKLMDIDGYEGRDEKSRTAKTPHRSNGDLQITEKEQKQLQRDIDRAIEKLSDGQP